uniref:neuropeptides B/W receptor type 2 n=1 Tax=Myxine glutinosa TaxID=7769 RepID=UPI00358FE8D0
MDAVVNGSAWSDVDTGGGPNHTNWTIAAVNRGFYIAIPVLYSLISAVGLTGNTAVVYVIVRGPKMKTVTNIFILNLAVADGLFTLVLPINVAEHLLRTWPFGVALCKIIVVIDRFNMYTSVYFLTVMSIDRYLVVSATVRSEHLLWRTYSMAKRTSLAVWLLVSVIVLPYAIFANTEQDPFGRTICNLQLPAPKQGWFKATRIYSLLFAFVLPVSTICYLYAQTLRKLRNMRLHTNTRTLNKAKRKVTLMVLAVVAICLVCWTPYHMASMVAITTALDETPTVVVISYLLTVLSYTNSCLNPFIYAFLDDNFRQSFQKLGECVPPCY